jgi:hypothetical protein
VSSVSWGSVTRTLTKDDNFLAELSKSNRAAFNSFALLEIIIATAKRSLSQCHHRSSLCSQGVSHFGSLAVAASHHSSACRSQGQRRRSALPNRKLQSCHPVSRSEIQKQDFHFPTGSFCLSNQKKGAWRRVASRPASRLMLYENQFALQAHSRMRICSASRSPPREIRKSRVVQTHKYVASGISGTFRTFVECITYTFQKVVNSTDAMLTFERAPKSRTALSSRA